ncbi:hypothetical protein BN000_01472 [Mycobacterium europaeum]|uniref:Helix-turn-helix domain-containing protein n=1 Tax=Mycobacterium europaeum TaxID=761804 RepID=A0A0U1D563_9MYCO|nr:hypothetical protein [Mycobacterium europaeum]CQD07372.1 hypothetical protein BN000_01472 [Mycobacterium europaeum]
MNNDSTGDGDVPTGELRTHSLAEVVAKHGLDQISVDPIRWLSMRLNRGELRGVRFGRHWRMRDTDVEYMLERYSNDDEVRRRSEESAASEARPRADYLGLSLRSRRLRGTA